MSGPFFYVALLLACVGCVKPPTLPGTSRFNVISRLNDSVWYGTGQLVRIKEAKQRREDVHQVNLLVYTDLDYPGMGDGPNLNTDNGCSDPECTRTQILMIYNIPLKKGRTSIAKLNKRGQGRQEYTNLSYVSNAGGLAKRYRYQGQKPGWVQVTKFDPTTGLVEGRFAICLREDMEVYGRLQNGMSETARFTSGLFRIKLTDITLR